MPRNNGKPYADEVRALEYMHTPLAGGLRMKKKYTCSAYSVRMFYNQVEFAALQEMRGLLELNDVIQVIRWCIRYANDNLPAHIELKRKKKYRERILCELERARKAGYELPQGWVNIANIW